MGRIARRKRAWREVRALMVARERECAAYVLAVIDGREPEAPEWMAASLAVWVQHATAEMFVRAAGKDPAAAMELAREVIAETAGGN